ncbi:LysR family transcriptional regulator [Xenorhabdus bovienii]|uniref:LysR family transcriptional regulator n=1 Tax=Xenorhabdus bovienii str. Intermedium TaxID=1379677 RepID=A0A077QBT8_XENBV|nr:LysR family transcriptional regulator [Xenorhabdus bovienii]CDH30859.1 LysR family transcriptional regulator [Xenorhabdus bovienii str. Intermedium]
MMMLDVDAVRAFIVISDLKSFTRAAEELGTTQGALSVKLKRLEEKIGKKLIERTPRQVRLSANGELFIKSARNFLEAHDQAIASLSDTRGQFKLGIACHVMGPEVLNILSKLKSLDPLLLIEIQLDSSRVLLDTYNNGDLDAIIIRNIDNKHNGTILCPEYFGWYAAPDFEYDGVQPLRLANLTPYCEEHDLTTKLLDQASIRWKVVFVGGGISAVTAAISAGIAVGVFPHRLAPSNLVDIGAAFGLPNIPSSSLIMYSPFSDKRTKEALSIITSAFQEHNNFSE